MFCRIFAPKVGLQFSELALRGVKKGFSMRTLSGLVCGAVLAAGLMVVPAVAQPTMDAPTSSPMNPAPVQAPERGGYAKPAKSPAVLPSPSAKPAMPTTTSADRKYERSYRHCKVRAQKRGLRGAERRNFIRRCELGFAPPRNSQAPPAPAPVPAPAKP